MCNAEETEKLLCAVSSYLVFDVYTVRMTHFCCLGVYIGKHARLGDGKTRAFSADLFFSHVLWGQAGGTEHPGHLQSENCRPTLSWEHC